MAPVSVPGSDAAMFFSVEGLIDSAHRKTPRVPSLANYRPNRPRPWLVSTYSKVALSGQAMPTVLGLCIPPPSLRPLSTPPTHTQLPPPTYQRGPLNTPATSTFTTRANTPATDALTGTRRSGRQSKRLSLATETESQGSSAPNTPVMGMGSGDERDVYGTNKRIRLENQPPRQILPPRPPAVVKPQFKAPQPVQRPDLLFGGLNVNSGNLALPKRPSPLAARGTDDAAMQKPDINTEKVKAGVVGVARSAGENGKANEIPGTRIDGGVGDDFATSAAAAATENRPKNTGADLTEVEKVTEETNDGEGNEDKIEVEENDEEVKEGDEIQGRNWDPDVREGDSEDEIGEGEGEGEGEREVIDMGDVWAAEDRNEGEGEDSDGDEENEDDPEMSEEDLDDGTGYMGMS